MICDIIPLSHLILDIYYFCLKFLLHIEILMLLAGVQCAKLAKEQLHQKQKGKKEVDVSYLYACVSDGLTYLFKT